MTLIDLKSGKLLQFEKYSTANSKIPKSQKDTGVRIKWLTDFTQLQTAALEEATELVGNIEDRGQYYKREEGVIGVLVHAGDEPCVFAGWYGNDHEGFYNVYGDQPSHSQQVYCLGDSKTIFVGLF